MIDAKAIAKELASKEVDDGDEVESDGLPGPADALRDMFKAMKAGDFDVAADAFRVAVSACRDEE
jgi:hypothetical protein